MEWPPSFYFCTLRLKNKKVDLLKYLPKIVHTPSKVPNKSNVWPDKIKSPPINKAGHLLSEPGFDPHSTPQFRDPSSNFAKQNSTP